MFDCINISTAISIKLTKKKKFVLGIDARKK